MSEKTSHTFDDLIQQINQTAGDIQRERGTLFEKLVLSYLRNEPTYQRLYKNVWTLGDVPAEYGIPKKDTGVDLVAEQFNGDLVAIQAKFYQDKIGKNEINSFVAELGKNYYQHGLIVSTVDDWNKNARDTIDHNEKGIEIIGLSDLRNSQIDWTKYSFERPEAVAVKEPKKLRSYQETALEYALEHFTTKDRGQMIMAPGTGKTFTSLKIAEAFSKKENKQFKVLYLVPSIQLLTQTLRGWNNDTELKITSMAVTSDRDASRGEDGTEDIKASDIGYPATTSTEKLLKNWEDMKKTQQTADMIVVFSTYQSIDVIGNAQKEGFPEFDLIISDEAHRTTGAHESSKEASVFSKVHSDIYVQGRKRIYQTATPKIYGESAKKNAKEKSILISSMDDENKYGEVFYRMGFGQAVSHGILTDYKVMVLAVDETAIQKDMQRTLADPENGLNIDDVGRIVGIWNGMMRRNGYKNPVKNSPYDGAPLERAIAFTRTIADSKKVSQQFEEVVNDYIGSELEEESIHLSMRHADGTMNALQKGEILDWLADPEKPSDEARIVSNVRFLTEGIDVPTLDAVIFLAPKKSQVDIVQAVGRIMRKAEGKDYGYIILPIVIPADETPETILDNNKNYEVVWQVINALRSVDERFEAMVDKLNIAKPKQLKVIGVGSAPAKGNDLINEDPDNSYTQTKLDLEWDKFEGAIFGKIVQKVGDRKYLENWSADVAKIAQRQIDWIKNKLKDKKDPITIEFKKFISSLQHNINESIDESQAAEMLSQHLITKPIFEALFDEYSFVNSNPVSSAMENIVKELENAGFAKEQENLEPLYESVKMRAEGIERAEDKQKIIITLYDKFFSTAFKSTTERLGIVFTPIEVVDFIVKSVDDVLNAHLGKTLSSENVHIMDPFTGTGTFIVRTLSYLKEQLISGKIKKEDVIRKYSQELHANEIVLLSYYIAAINIESTFDEITGKDLGYTPFEGIVLTDTFESTEVPDTLDDEYFGSNDERLKRQQEVPITAIIGNPPYSARQESENDDNKNISYTNLDEQIREDYAQYTNVRNKNTLYDSLFRAFKWSTNRLKDKGVIAYITNSSFIDSQTTSGIRKDLFEQFNYIYVLNLRGAVRGKSGIDATKEGGNIFDILTGVSINIFIKDGSNTHEVYYYDIGESLSKNQKLEFLANKGSIQSIDWVKTDPDANNDWINHRDEDYLNFLPLDSELEGLFLSKSLGVSTNRDIWVYGFNKKSVIDNTEIMVENFNSEIKRLKDYTGDKLTQINQEKDYISWSSGLKSIFKRGNEISLDKSKMRLNLYRPFTKKWLYYDDKVIERSRNFRKSFGGFNKVILVPGTGSRRDFSTIITDKIPDLNVLDAGAQGFSRYNNENSELLEIDNSNMRESVVNKLGLSEEEAFYYTYGVLHSPEYRTKYANDLQKALPRIPILQNMEKYVEIGRQLADLHLNYESVSPYEDVILTFKSEKPSYEVNKMKHPKVKNQDGKSVNDKSKIIFNDEITLSNIPEKAYGYIVNGKSAVEWIMDQYKVKLDNSSGIVDDPNSYSEDPKYILNLLLSIITVSMETLELIEKLPSFEILE
ncbi:DEAD/DEAH box helicase [Enterococcus faecalis]|uniref:DEAD/DEAH box helicase n=1 Tax=Enterococcus faecalis TaxID=1351 RepID=UPI0001B25B9E|nr:type ISP restriction/modification enzyme [Enterococcus faecalis]EEU21911.1 endonuclease and methylase LlaGI [Enterococcus faecalis T3]EGO8222228.1 DEAD/DEAH box helicase [Enterococcus faecalis]EHU9665143.1 DEAD/DEAH box helicase [Enterococcus faecalis]EIA7728123.1 DEAD/DEAH box helicase [Enterococcus faecalis]KAJ71265.1 DNA or RNA helicase of superfamily II [Enterococcus faecalis AZ19]